MKRISLVLLVVCFIFTLCSPAISAEEMTPVTPSNIPISELDSFISNYTDQHIGKTTPGASIVVVQDDNVVHAMGYGFTSIENDKTVDAYTTVFEWGSISKLFVWVAALQLVERGKLDLNKPISSYLDKEDMPKLEYDEPITMLHLMNHTAGFEEYILNLIVDSKDELEPLQQALKHSQPKQSYKPGQIVSYSNYSTSLAALVIENITKLSYEDYVKEHILIPLEMNDTIVTIANDNDLQKIEQLRATGYFSLKPEQFIEMPFSYLSMYPSGSLNGPATDLAKFAQALLAKTDEANKLFSSLSTLDLLYTSTYSPDSQFTGIAHGFWEYAGVYESYSHGGNTAGFATNIHIIPEADFAVIVLTNQVAEFDLTYRLVDSLISNKEEQKPNTILALNKELNYDQSFITARNTNHTFTKLFFYLTPLTFKPDFETNILHIHTNGLSASYEQITPNGFRLVEGPSLFFTLKDIYLFTDNNEIRQIHAPFNGYLPTTITPIITLLSLVLLVIVAVYMLVFSIIYLFRKKLSLVPLKLYASLMLLQVISFINISILAGRMLINSYKTTQEIIVHFYLSYGLGVATLLLLSYLIYKVFRRKILLRFSFYSTVISVVTYQLTILFWRFYFI